MERAIRDIPVRAYTSNTIVNLAAPDGSVLSIGIALPHSDDNPSLEEALACVNFTPAQDESHYPTVVGNSELTYENGGVVVFRYEEGTWTEIFRRNCVPIETMIQIAKHFFETGKLAPWATWEDA